MRPSPDGRLAAGERLPSTRALAAALGVSRTVVTAAYTQLFAEGWLEGRHGSGTYVAPGAAGPPGGGADPALRPAGPGPGQRAPAVPSQLAPSRRVCLSFPVPADPV